MRCQYIRHYDQATIQLASLCRNDCFEFGGIANGRFARIYSEERVIMMAAQVSASAVVSAITNKNITSIKNMARCLFCRLLQFDDT